MSVTRFEIIFVERKGFEKPMPSPRPRFRNAGKFVQTYMPTSYTKHKEYIQRQMPKLLIENSIKLTILFEMPMLKNWSNPQKQRMIKAYHSKKPDIDNLLKTVLDAANGHLWIDDGQIVEIHSAKRYAETTKIKIKLEEI
ncbi:RusA family crossover junction endodeoxyribonuclease [Macrococcoides canis]|uniref:RusA family crossover junction endodeoxyribonuclease n=1 Tax=Macrococcoides canis TaxID=1855823 RepID=UPI00207D06E1|nr:RusA family crossover junction endodeoxyribonuclease [Macrococcus canis]MCO4095724.1 RusA family crossover junction endodeoxyribonuclease [Macrococcus canis]UTH08433.1 RusA family crossover junction endodeoxyribonuclease [Macrococcus canis]